MKMSKYYADHLLEAIRLHNACGWSYNELADHGFCYSKGVNDAIRGTFNRFVKIGATEFDVAAWLNGEYLTNVKALEYHLRFVGGRDRQISSVALADELGVYDIARLRCVLRGMSITHYDLCYYTDTLDLDCLTIR